MVTAMMRYGRQQLSEIDEWTLEEFFDQYDSLIALTSAEAIPDGG